MANDANDDDYDDVFEPLFTERQSMVLTVLPWVTSPISIVASALLIRIIWIDRKAKLRHTYHRLLLSMSCMDVINSLNLAQSGWVVPTGTPGVWGARGTTTTCDVNGFFFHVGFAEALYTTCLSIYYSLVIVFEWRPSTIRRYVEPWMHVISVLYPVIAASVAVFSGMMNPMRSLSGWCYLAYYPIYCEALEDVECTRGMGYMPLEMYATALTIVMCFVLVTLCLGFVVRKVFFQERRTSPKSTLQADRRHYRTREASIQALSYIGNFLLTFLPLAFISFASIQRPYVAENRNYYFPISISVKITYPLQGLWNFIIYIRPRITAMAQRHSDWSWRELISESLRLERRRKQLDEGADSFHDEGADTANDTTLSAEGAVSNPKEDKDDFAPELDIHLSATLVEGSVDGFGCDDVSEEESPTEGGAYYSDGNPMSNLEKAVCNKSVRPLRSESKSLSWTPPSDYARNKFMFSSSGMNPRPPLSDSLSLGNLKF